MTPVVRPIGLTAGLTTNDRDIRMSYARDVSGIELIPELVARPESAEQVCEILRAATIDKLPVTPAGAQTSTTGASITDTGILLSLRGLSRIYGVDTTARTIRVQTGALVADVRRTAESSGLLFTPDPTSEEECTIGGAIACNASGARSLLYGATAPHVRALTVALANGSILELRRPQLEKNTVGFPVAQDPVDWFVGSEGLLGVILEAEFALYDLPAKVTGLAIPFACEADALEFVVAARRSAAVRPRCLEFFDKGSMEIARSSESAEHWPHDTTAMIYTEEASAENANNCLLDNWLSLASTHRATTDDIRVYDSPNALHIARHMRHAVPQTMNELGAARRQYGGRKVSTDWAVPYPKLAAALDLARHFADQAGTPHGIAYGHAGNGHPHQNIIAQDAEELKRIEQVVEKTLREVIRMGGTVAAEHGIGKLKRKWLPLQMSETQLRIMRALKHELDPLGILSPGNVFSD